MPWHSGLCTACPLWNCTSLNSFLVYFYYKIATTGTKRDSIRPLPKRWKSCWFLNHDKRLTFGRFTPVPVLLSFGRFRSVCLVSAQRPLLTTEPTVRHVCSATPQWIHDIPHTGAHYFFCRRCFPASAVIRMTKSATSIDCQRTLRCFCFTLPVSAALNHSARLSHATRLKNAGSR